MRFCAKSQLSRFAVWKARKDALGANGRQPLPNRVTSELPVFQPESVASVTGAAPSHNRTSGPRGGIHIYKCRHIGHSFCVKPISQDVAAQCCN